MKPATVILAFGVLIIATAGPRGDGFAAGVWADTGHRSPPDPRAAIFVQRGCTECHAISALGVSATRDVGPDLTFAYADVVNRYGVNLESFLSNPTGVMRLMLASHLHLSVADRDSIVHILKGLYDERRADMDDEVPSFPPELSRPRALPRPSDAVF